MEITDYRQPFFRLLSLNSCGTRLRTISPATLVEPDYDQYLPIFRDHVFFEISPTITEVASPIVTIDKEPPRPDVRLEYDMENRNSPESQELMLWCAWYLCQGTETRKQLANVAKETALNLFEYYYGPDNIPQSEPERMWRCGTVLLGLSDKETKSVCDGYDLEDNMVLVWWASRADEIDHIPTFNWESIFPKAGKLLRKHGYFTNEITEQTSKRAAVVVMGEPEKSELSNLRLQTLNDLKNEGKIDEYDCRLQIRGPAAQVPKMPITLAEFEAKNGE